MSDRWGDSRRDRDDLDDHLTRDPENLDHLLAPASEWREVEVEADLVETGDQWPSYRHGGDIQSWTPVVGTSTGRAGSRWPRMATVLLEDGRSISTGAYNTVTIRRRFIIDTLNLED